MYVEVSGGRRFTSENTGMGWVVVGLALAGLVLAVSFTAAFYRPAACWPGCCPGGLRPESRARPFRDRERQGHGGRSELRDNLPSPGARIFGVPISLLGLIYYGAAIGIALCGFPPALPLAFSRPHGLPWRSASYLGYRLLRVERMSLSVVLDGARAQYASGYRPDGELFPVRGGVVAGRPKSTFGATFAASGAWNSGYPRNRRWRP